MMFLYLFYLSTKMNYLYNEFVNYFGFVGVIIFKIYISYEYIVNDTFKDGIMTNNINK